MTATIPPKVDPAEPMAAALDPALVVEAALFSAGKPLSVDEIAENTRLPQRATVAALEKLRAEYDARRSALEIARAGTKWVMQVRTLYAPSTTRLAPMEVAPKLLKTLALIAYHQPVLQSDLKGMIGDKVYEHVKELKERGLVKKRLHENSFLLSTTDSFAEYFGIPAQNREEIRNYLARKVGIAAAAPPVGGAPGPAATPAAEGASSREGGAAGPAKDP